MLQLKNNNDSMEETNKFMETSNEFMEETKKFEEDSKKIMEDYERNINLHMQYYTPTTCVNLWTRFTGSSLFQRATAKYSSFSIS